MGPARYDCVRLFALVCVLTSLRGQGLEYVKANYTKYEYEVAMRDGKKLFTAVYMPKDRAESYPILLNRTPYGVAPYGVDQYRPNIGPSDLAAKEKYIIVYQDVRGRKMSEGEFINMTPHKPEKRGPQDVDESSDTYDTIEWLVKNLPNNNGRVGTWGISYPGFYTAAGMIDAHPAHKAASPQAPITDWFLGDDFHHNGALYLPHAFRFFASFGRPRPGPSAATTAPFQFPTPDGYTFYLKMGPLFQVNEKHFKNDVAFWNEMMKHSTYDGFWRSRNLRPHLKNIRPAVMTVGGWFDAENLFGALAVYKSVEAASPGAQNMLVMGPWYHGGWNRSDGDALGDVRFNAKTSLYYREQIELPFFNLHLKGKGSPRLPEAYVFETGTNQWRLEEAWPPKNARPRTLHFHARGGLSFDAPTDDAAFDEYVSDPARPVPYIGNISSTMTREHMVGDQRFAATRPDVLVYETPVLSEDVTIAGPIEVNLFVSTSGTDSDWIVKLVDVYPGDTPDNDPNPAGVKMGGYQQLLRGDVMRGKFRNSFEKPEPFQPGQPAPVRFTMNDLYHTFRRGHQIMVQVQSTWFPLVDRNPQQFLEINTSTEGDFRKATQRIYRSRSMGSHLRVLVAR